MLSVVDQNKIIQEIEKRIKKLSKKAVKSDIAEKGYYRVGALVLHELKVDLENEFFKDKEEVKN